jgi:hypothetical protein
VIQFILASHSLQAFLVAAMFIHHVSFGSKDSFRIIAYFLQYFIPRIPEQLDCIAGFFKDVHYS